MSEQTTLKFQIKCSSSAQEHPGGFSYERTYPNCRELMCMCAFMWIWRYYKFKSFQGKFQQLGLLRPQARVKVSILLKIRLVWLFHGETCDSDMFLKVLLREPPLLWCVEELQRGPALELKVGSERRREAGSWSWTSPMEAASQDQLSSAGQWSSAPNLELSKCERVGTGWCVLLFQGDLRSFRDTMKTGSQIVCFCRRHWGCTRLQSYCFCFVLKTNLQHRNMKHM